MPFSARLLYTVDCMLGVIEIEFLEISFIPHIHGHLK